MHKPYRCPLCDDEQGPWLLYPALGRPICAECEALLLDDDLTLMAACRAFDLGPALLEQIVERQRPLHLTAEEAADRFGEVAGG